MRGTDQGASARSGGQLAENYTVTDYATDIGLYTNKVDQRAIDAIVKHLGIALKSKDASGVAISSKSELERVREGWLKKHLKFTASDADLDASIKAVGEAMKADKTKSRVTFYYLLAEKHGKIAELAK